MDRQGYEQLERIELKLNNVTKGIEIILEGLGKEEIIEWYRFEVESDEGKLIHLREDGKLKEYIERLEEEYDEETTKLTEAEEEYKQ